MTPQRRSSSRSVRALVALAAVIVIMLISVLGNETLSPGHWRQQFKVSLGLDLSSGTQVTMKAETHDGSPPSGGEMQQAIAVEQSRVDGTGTSGAQVQQSGSDMIVVTVPGTPAYNVVSLVSQASQMSVRPVYLEAPYVPPSAAGTSPVAYGNSALVNAATMRLFDKEACRPSRVAGTVNPSWQKTVGYSQAGDQWNKLKGQIVSCDSSGTKYVLGQAVYVGGDITSVSAGLQSGSAQWVVNLSLNGAAAARFSTLTTSQYDSYQTGSRSGSADDQALDSTAVVLDGNVTSAEVTAEPIPGGNVQITGGGRAGFTHAQAAALADALKYGSLPLNFQPQAATTVSAQVGHSQLVAGLVAGAIGLSLVTIYLFAYYRGLGLVAVSSLLLAALLAYLSVVLLSKYKEFTLSLSAIAGLVVAIGITADSFITYFERLRDAVRDGKSLRPAAESGWKRARRTILMADTVSFLAAALMYHFAVSDVQGFAYTLGLTTLIDVLVVFGFTKPMVTLLAGTRFFGGGHRWSGLDPARLGAKAPWRSSAR
ncbi:MAG TPA: protein translocase subunit SecD [Trebonia sp.]|nr:protein translocase subunit SecD [Trebonia sp.]